MDRSFLDTLEVRIDADRYRYFYGADVPVDAVERDTAEGTATSNADIAKAMERIDALLPSLNNRGWVLRPGTTIESLARTLWAEDTNIDQIYMDIVSGMDDDTKNRFMSYGIAPADTTESQAPANPTQSSVVTEQPQLSGTVPAITEMTSGDAYMVTGNPTLIDAPAIAGTGTSGLIEALQTTQAVEKQEHDIKSDTRAQVSADVNPPASRKTGFWGGFGKWLEDLCKGLQ